LPSDRRADRPWEGDDQIAAGDPRGWQTIAPSPIASGAGLPVASGWGIDGPKTGDSARTVTAAAGATA
jgi:hypothetical protein